MGSSVLPPSRRSACCRSFGCEASVSQTCLNRQVPLGRKAFRFITGSLITCRWFLEIRKLLFPSGRGLTDRVKLPKRVNLWAKLKCLVSFLGLPGVQRTCPETSQRIEFRRSITSSAYRCGSLFYFRFSSLSVPGSSSTAAGDRAELPTIMTEMNDRYRKPKSYFAFHVGCRFWGRTSSCSRFEYLVSGLVFSEFEAHRAHGR